MGDAGAGRPGQSYPNPRGADIEIPAIRKRKRPGGNHGATAGPGGAPCRGKVPAGVGVFPDSCSRPRTWSRTTGPGPDRSALTRQQALDGNQVTLLDCKSAEQAVNLQDYLDTQFDGYLRKVRDGGKQPVGFL